MQKTVGYSLNEQQFLWEKIGKAKVIHNMNMRAFLQEKQLYLDEQTDLQKEKKKRDVEAKGRPNKLLDDKARKKLEVHMAFLQTKWDFVSIFTRI